MPGFAPPYAGARLVWSNSSASTVVFDPESINGDDHEWLLRDLTRRLAPLSALSRGSDHEYRIARQAELAAHRELSQSRVQEAEEAGNQNAQISALREQVASLKEEAEIWEDVASQAEAELAEVKQQAEKVTFLEQQIDQLNSILIAAPAGSSGIQPDPWETLPDLIMGSEESALSLYLQLEDLSERHLVFSDRAVTSWKKAKYPFPKEMQEALVKLARVAVKLYDGSDRSMPHLDVWIREEFDLKVALNDEVIEKSPKLNKFTHDGQSYNRTPHVKVRDNAPHQHVGRIHFALDAKGERIIVDHVGVKLY